ncbi:ABC transporter substrate-binding protein [Deinococcus sonorensis]|uniref:ABC transporter substrate-binding protein n=2 Tax=Deinococcus sonorensis TaxID=309891 RepID=A0AAU7U8K2_9DEIO
MKKQAIVITSLALILAACGNKSGTANTFVIQESADIPTLDPGVSYDTASGQFIENIYETLLTYDGSSLSKLKGLLATSWKADADGKTYTFALRDGVKFHSGNSFTCADAEYSFRRNLVTNSAESGNWFLSESLLGTGSNAKDDKSITWARIAAAVKCSNPSTLVFTLPKPDPAFLAKLAFTGQSIVDMKHAQKIGEWDGTEATWQQWVGKDLTDSALSKDPSGTGAYRMIKRDANSLAAQAFDGYWGGKPKIENVLYQKVSELAARQQALLKGDADIIEAGTRANVEQQLQGQKGITVLDELPNTSSFAIFMNENIGNKAALGSGKLDGKGIPANFFSDVNVRRGFNYAFDTVTYIRDVQQGKGKARTMLLPDTFPGYDAEVPTYSFDWAKAKDAFQQAFGGQLWNQGFTINASYRTGSEASQTAMEILKKNVESINPKFHVNLTAKQWSTMIQDANAGREVMLLNGWAPDYADPDNFLYTFYSSKGYYQPSSNFKDTQIDAWLDQARSITSANQRAALYSQVGQRAYDQAYYINVPAAAGIIAFRSGLEGLTLETYNPMRSFIGGTLWKDLSKS